MRSAHAAEVQQRTVRMRTAAKLLDVSVEHIQRLVKSGELPAKKLDSGPIFIRVVDLDAYIDSLPDA